MSTRSELGVASRKIRQRRRRGAAKRRGAAMLDYALVLGVVMPAVALIMMVAPRVITRVFEMSCTLVSWPFM